MLPTPMPSPVAQDVPFVHVFAAMTTRCELQLHGVSPAQGRDIAACIEARVAALVRRYNFHASDSWLNRVVNGRRHSVVEVDAECARVLGTVREHAQRTGGAFDITVGTLAGPLRQARTTADVAAAWRRLSPYLGLARWQLDGPLLHFDNPCTRLDLGGVIKEYAVDESARIARAFGASAGLVNYGGDLFAFGLKRGGQRFVAAVPNPLAPERMLFGLDLEDQALTTSAHYARHRVLGGRQGGVLSHVVGADPAQARWISASVVSASALLSGIYSTALLIRNQLNLPPGMTAVTVDAQGRITTLTGASDSPAALANQQNTRIASCA